MTEKEKEKVLSLQDVIEEKKKPMQVPIVGMDGYIEYISPSGIDMKRLKEEVDQDIKIVIEREKMNAFDNNGSRIPGSKLSTSVELELLKQTLLGEKKILLGLSKADKTITAKMFEELSDDVKSQISLYITQETYKGVINNNEVEGLKNLLELAKV